MASNDWWDQLQREQQLDRSHNKKHARLRAEKRAEKDRRCPTPQEIDTVAVAISKERVCGCAVDGLGQVCCECTDTARVALRSFFELAERLGRQERRYPREKLFDVFNWTSRELSYLINLTGVNIVRTRDLGEPALRKTAQQVHAKLKQIGDKR